MEDATLRHPPVFTFALRCVQKVLVLCLVSWLVPFLQTDIQACSMYKVTESGKTMVGCNHDAWLTTPKIWFVTAKESGAYGACFTGARQVSGQRTSPQSGMNTEGLAFSRLASMYPKQDQEMKGRLPIKDEAEYLTGILQACATVEEVKAYIAQYDHSFFLQSVFIYVDRFGDYLVVEPYGFVEGNDPHYLLANFCPSVTSNDQARKMDRYRKGEEYLLRHEREASFEFCTALSDTMHVCRNRNGDGTLLTSIWDTSSRLVHLYFYHSYDTAMHFSLTDELAKGDHVLSLPELFPPNSEFERLVHYKTPSNSVEIRISLVVIGGLLAFLSFLLGLTVLRKRSLPALPHVLLTSMLTLNLLMIIYLAVLLTNRSIFYFDVPYVHHSSALISASSYLPFLLLALLGPILLRSKSGLISSSTGAWAKTILVSNNFLYLLLLGAFAYWGLFSVWN